MKNMSYSSGSWHKRSVAGILGMLLLLVVVFSAFYIASETHHDCEGDDCPICACIQQCENTLGQIACGTALLTALLLPIVLALFPAFRFARVFPQETLVSIKVRLND
ncbi:MAG: hypothetical protein K6F53_07225 [Lachnospiraceae bacterium]|nr:hypothetical protein [Lachnospiraceae bacterium]